MSVFDKTWMDRDSNNLLPSRSEEESSRDSLIGLGRRGFLKGLGVSGVVALTACDRLPLRKAIPYLIAPEEITPGVVVPYASTCTGCPASCGLMVHTRDGRPIKLEGLPEHPHSLGGLCARGQAELRGLYDAGRLRGPTVRGEKVSWKEVDSEVGRSLRNSQGNTPVAVLMHRSMSPTARATVSRFAEKLGAWVTVYAPPGDAVGSIADAYELLDGAPKVPRARLDEVDLLVTVGDDALGTGPDSVPFGAQYAKARERRARGGVFHHLAIEGSLSLTGAGADTRHLATVRERKEILAGVLSELLPGSGNPLEGLVEREQLKSAGKGQRKMALRLSQKLRASAKRSLVTGGSDDLTEQLLIAMINRALGNEGETLLLENDRLYGTDEEPCRNTRGSQIKGVGGSDHPRSKSGGGTSRRRADRQGSFRFEAFGVHHGIVLPRRRRLARSLLRVITPWKAWGDASPYRGGT